MDVLVLGGGYAGIMLTRRLERLLPEDVDLRLLDATGTHLIQHELHRLIRYPSLVSQLEIPLHEITSRATIFESTVTKIEREQGIVYTASNERLDPDILAICLGAVTADYGLPGVREYGQPLKRIEHAASIRDRFRGLPSGADIVVGGAGLSGIQVSGELAAMRDDIHIRLVEQEASVAPQFAEPFQGEVRAQLERAGVSVMTGRCVKEATGTELLMADGRTLPYDQFIWTGGIKGSTATSDERIPVRADLRVADHTFALGDAAQVTDDQGQTVPASAQTAVRQARVAATNVSRLVDAERKGDLVFTPRLERYVFDSPGWVVSIGDEAVAQVGDQVVSGPPAQTIKSTVGAGYLSSIGRIRESLKLLREELAMPSRTA